MIALIQIPNTYSDEKYYTDTGISLPLWVPIVWIFVMLILALLLLVNSYRE